MAEIRGRYVYDDDLTPGNRQNGGLSQNLYRDDGRVEAHATFIPDDEAEDAYEYDSNFDSSPQSRQLTEEERELAEIVAAVFALVIVISVKEGIKWAAPRIAEWWRAKARPNLKAAWAHVPRPRRFRAVNTYEPPALRTDSLTQASLVTSKEGVELAIADAKITMSEEEWQVRYQAMLAASAFSEQQRRILANAQIYISDKSIEGKGPTRQLNPQQFANRVKRMLEANPSLLNEDLTIPAIEILARSTQDEEDKSTSRQLLFEIDSPSSIADAEQPDDDGLIGMPK